jgi:hypothetical protein
VSRSLFRDWLDILLTVSGTDTMEIAGRLSQIVREEKPARVASDITGQGVRVYDRLPEMGASFQQLRSTPNRRGESIQLAARGTAGLIDQNEQ